jgi:hypothetical protein
MLSDVVDEEFLTIEFGMQLVKPMNKKHKTNSRPGFGRILMLYRQKPLHSLDLSRYSVLK